MLKILSKMNITTLTETENIYYDSETGNKNISNCMNCWIRNLKISVSQKVSLRLTTTDFALFCQKSYFELLSFLIQGCSEPQFYFQLYLLEIFFPIFWMKFPQVKFSHEKSIFPHFENLIHALSKNILCRNKSYWCYSIFMSIRNLLKMDFSWGNFDFG